MTDALQHLIDALRDELQQYGGMLALLDQQQEQVCARVTDDLLPTVMNLQEQGSVMQGARRLREECRTALARTFGLRDEAPFMELIPRLPASFRPLVQALVDENNDLLRRVQQRARQNHILLSRSVELMQSLIGSLVPQTRPLTYGHAGRMASPALPSRALYDAIG
ncbi:MAG: flagellar protein FlgN [Verrucomicrobia bacterium]|nr:flagellar protein FlgN [Verrucomicrobiota bacterium]